jgi:hypothetical protein
MTDRPTQSRRRKSAGAGAPLILPAAPALAVPRHVAARRHAIHVKQTFTAPVVDYDKPGAEDEADPHAAADFALGKRIWRALQTWYPDQRWQVRVDHAQGIIGITLPILMKRNLYQVVHIKSLAADPGLKCIMRAAGECLERLGLPRAGFSLDRFLEARTRGPYGRKPVPKLIVPEFASSARPKEAGVSVAP